MAELTTEEQNKTSHTILSLRLLFVSLRGTAHDHSTYSSFCTDMPDNLLRSIKPWDVLLFIQRMAQLDLTTPSIIVFAMDEVRAEDLVLQFTQAL